MKHKPWTCVVCGGAVFADRRAKDFLEIDRKDIVWQQPLDVNETLARNGKVCSIGCYSMLSTPGYVEVMVWPDAHWERCEEMSLDIGEVNAKSDDCAPIWFPAYMEDEALDVAVHDLVEHWPTS